MAFAHACIAALFLLALPAQAVAVGPEGGLDGRAWEMVTPADKNEGEAGAPTEVGAGAFQAASGGGAIAFGSRASFAEPQGAPPISQYVARRNAGGWTSENLSPPLLSGTYAAGAYQLFSVDLSRGLLENGWRCRDGGTACGAENPSLDPLAPAGYRTLYLGEGGDFRSLLSTANSPALTVPPAGFGLTLAGASSDLGQAVFSTCAAITANATEVAAPGGCDQGAPNLYRWSAVSLSAVNLLPGQTETDPGAELAAPAGAVSADGSRVYWRGGNGNLYLRDGSATVQIDQGVGGGGQFQSASQGGSVAFFTKAGHLYRFVAGGGSIDLTPGGDVQGVLGSAADGSRVYYSTGAGLFLWQAGGPLLPVADGADAVNWPPATGVAQVSPDATRIAFVSSQPLTGFPHGGIRQVYLYESLADRLVCVSCNPYGTVPLGAANLPAPRSAGEGAALYTPRALSADRSRLFFDSADRLVDQDTDELADVYEWEAQGVGSCGAAGGCLGLVSNGRTGADEFLDASADGEDAFFLTSASLVSADPGRLDVYDARVEGGFPDPPPGAPCEGDECQGPAPAPNDPTPSTAAENAANPAPRFATEGRKKAKKKKKKRKKRRGGAKKPGAKGGRQ